MLRDKRDTYPFDVNLRDISVYFKIREGVCVM